MRLRLLAAAAVCLALPLSLQAQQPGADHQAMSGMEHGPEHGSAHPAKPPVPPSHAVIVNFQGRSLTLKVEDLLALPQTTIHVHNAHANKDETYTGPLLGEVLARIGLHADKESEPLILHSSLVATATDNYYVLYSLAECEPSFSQGQVVVAVMREGLPDPSGIQLVNTTDAKPARWIHGLTNLNVVSMAQSH